MIVCLSRFNYVLILGDKVYGANKKRDCYAVTPVLNFTTVRGNVCSYTPYVTDICGTTFENAIYVASWYYSKGQSIRGITSSRPFVVSNNCFFQVIDFTVAWTVNVFMFVVALGFLVYSIVISCRFVRKRHVYTSIN